MAAPAVSREAGDGLLVFARVTPKAPRDGIDGIWRGDDGRQAVKVRVRAAPEKGAANKAVATVLARALGRPKSAGEVVAGPKDRMKTVLIRGDTKALQAALGRLLADSP
ncbi:DUF167 domain-containing protein [Kaustia mangrovi]|uniref:UPF0235 protein HW532_05830 n=1 Tax=Kaustia mangrovi TaxID=2593653 RepID=A0A7S8C2N9_9HYPH|nr:DUF167 family protein [Kaustia mangrovi]QPC42264.1 DUF167 domain-containing protein [Kaustia mangrovi]